MVENLVELVRANPVLYDATLSEYKRDAQSVQTVWTSIAEAMGRRDVDGE